MPLHLARCWVVVATLSLLATAAAVADDQANALPNPGFEDGDAHWTIDEDTSQVTADAARTGSMGLRIGAEHYVAGGASVHSSRLPVTPGQQVTVTFEARAERSVSGVFLWFLDADGKMLRDPDLPGDGLNKCVADITDGDWHEYPFEGAAPAGAASVGLWIHTWSGSSGQVDLDDFTLGGIAPDAVAVDPPPRRSRPAKPVPDEMPPREAPPIIILKLDDFRQAGGFIHERWLKIADYLQQRDIKSGFGTLCQTLEEATPEYVEWIKQRHDSGIVEFWFHGWDHASHTVDGTRYNEFTGRSYDEQKRRVDDSQRLALEKLGFAFTCFGPPGGSGRGSFNEATIPVMADDPYITAWMYPRPIDEAGEALNAAGKVMILDRVWDVGIEGAVGVPDLARLITGLANHPDREYFVLQGHPAMWTDERFGEFERIVDCLVEQDAVFMTPSGYAAEVRAGDEQ